VTQADYRVLTPDHASPEQIRGDPITTASDTYVLGVVLYELLCACKPFTLKGNRLGDLEQAICEETPPAPSAVVQARDDAAEIARQRGASPARLRRELAGDLDNIVLMAMRKEPERRYSSVEQFAADVQRHLDGMPVLARADAWSYRAGKFLARHSLAVGLAVAFLAVLVGFSVTTYLQAQRIAHERDLAEAERARALTSQQRAEAVKDFLIDSFRLADPSHARGKEITAREILDQGAARIGKGAALAAGSAGDAARHDRQRLPQSRSSRRRATVDRARAGSTPPAVRPTPPRRGEQPVQPQSRVREEGRSEDCGKHSRSTASRSTRS
jgi:hypothetical protein